MNDSDFIALAALLREEFEQIGAPHLAADENFVTRSDLEAAPRLVDPRTHVIELLRTLERYLAIQDQQVYQVSMARINETLDGESRLRGAVVLPVRRETLSEPAPAGRDLESAPRLGLLRQQVTTLINELLETPYEPEPDEA